MAETMPEYIYQPSFKLGSCFENVLKFHNNCPLQSNSSEKWAQFYIYNIWFSNCL